MKRFLLLILFFMILGFTSQAATTEVELTINGQPITMDHSIIYSPTGVLLAPLEDFFAELQVPIDPLPNEQLAVFRDNVFFKFRPGSGLYEINGREHVWTIAPYAINDVLYGEIELILEYMDFGVNFDVDNRRLEIRTSQALDSFRPESSALKQVPSLGTGLMYSVPTFWSRQDSGGYGTRLMNQRILVDLKQIQTERTVLTEVVAEYLSNLGDAHEGFQAQPIRTVEAGLFEAIVYRFDLIIPKLPADAENHMISYGFFELNEQFFVVILDSNLKDYNFLEQVMNDTLKSVQSKAYSIDSLSEHYVEFRNYSQFGTFISSPIYSNIQIYGELPFRGNIDPAIEYLKVVVQKGARRFDYQIPVVYGSFDESIPIPFGLGFHRVTISLPDTIEGEEDFFLLEDTSTLLKFSVINRSLGESLLTSSSLWVNKNHEQVISDIADISDSLTNYEKAKEAFMLLSKFEASSNQTMDQLLADGSGSSRAVASVYTAYLRAMNIPTRIVKNSLLEEYFVEFFSNGKWIFTRPASFIRLKTMPENYFDVPRPSGIRLDLMDY